VSNTIQKEEGSMSFQDDQIDQDDRDISLMAHDQYMRLVNWTPRLSDEEIIQLLQRVARGKAEQMKACPDSQVLAQAKEARDHLVVGLQRLVMCMAQRCHRRSQRMELLDLIQEGNVGLLHAIERHEPQRDREFIGFASISIRQALWQAVIDRSELIRLPENIGRVVSKAYKVERQLVITLGRDPCPAEVAQEMGIEEQTLHEALACEQQRRSMKSLQGLLREEDAEDQHRFVSLFEAWVEGDKARRVRVEQAVEEAMMTLSRRERDVIRMRYGLDGQCLNGPDMAQVMGTTLKAVECLGVNARKRLRQALAPVVLEGQAEDEGKVA
jgi:RNA polymerase primary sigma factor